MSAWRVPMGGYDRRLVQAITAIRRKEIKKDLVVPPTARNVGSVRQGGKAAVIERQRFVRECVLRGLSGALPLTFHCFDSLEDLQSRDDAASFELVILSWTRSDDIGRSENLQVLNRIRAELPGTSVMVLASGTDSDLARAAIVGGAQAFIPMNTGL